MDDLNKRYYRISEVAEIIGLPATTLRFWEKHFTIIKPHRDGHGSRFYTPADIETLRMIHFMVKEQGFKLEAAQAHIKANRDGVDRRRRAVERLRGIRDRLQQMLDALPVPGQPARHPD